MGDENIWLGLVFEEGRFVGFEAYVVTQKDTIVILLCFETFVK